MYCLQCHYWINSKPVLTVVRLTTRQTERQVMFCLLFAPLQRLNMICPEKPSCLSTEDRRLSIVENYFCLFVWSTSKHHHLLSTNVIECVEWPQSTCSAAVTEGWFVMRDSHISNHVMKATINNTAVFVVLLQVCVCVCVRVRRT